MENKVKRFGAKCKAGWVYTSMLSACAAKSGWVGVLASVRRRARPVPARARHSIRTRTRRRSILRGELMTYCGELMQHLMTSLLTYLLTLLFTGLAFSLSSTARLTAATVPRKHNMSIKQTLAQLKAMGCKATYSKDWEEYRVTLPNLDAKREEAIAYYTSDAEDALATGAAMKGLG